MKTFITKSKISALFLVVISLPAWARPVARVSEINGSVFMVKPDGSTTTLLINQHIDEKSEVMVEEGASVTLNDYYDSTYHLVGGTHLKMFDRSAQLKKGKTWIQSLSSRFPLALTTANGHATYWKSEFIVTFDQTNSRSQFLVVNGELEVSNVLDREMRQSVPGGSFSIIDPEVDDGLPRAATQVGYASLNSALSEFKKLPSSMKADKLDSKLPVVRSIASVEEEKSSAPPKKGEIIFIKTNRLPASVTSGAVKNRKKHHLGPLTDAPIKYHGTSWNPLEQRAPASIAPKSPVFGSAASKTAAPPLLDPEFEHTLKQKAYEQPKHPKELDRLLEDLKSY